MSDQNVYPAPADVGGPAGAFTTLPYGAIPSGFAFRATMRIWSSYGVILSIVIVPPVSGRRSSVSPPGDDVNAVYAEAFPSSS